MPRRGRHVQHGAVIPMGVLFVNRAIPQPGEALPHARQVASLSVGGGVVDS